MVSFSRKSQELDIKTSKRVKKIDVRLTVADATGNINITDVMLQGGSVPTVWVGHTSEIKWSFDN